MKNIIAICCLFGLVGFSGHATAQSVYTWVDENGVRHYGDHAAAPTPQQEEQSGRKVERKLVRAPRPSSPVPQSSQPPSQINEDYDGAEEASQDAAPDPSADTQINQTLGQALINQEDCAIAKQNMAVLSSAQMAVEKGENGEDIVLDDRARAEAIIAAQADVTRYCGPGQGVR